MIPIIDFERRSINGKMMNVQAFDDLLMDTALELVEKYDLNFGRDEILADDKRADAVFDAAVEFLARVGIYNRTNSAVIQWSPEEIEDLVADYSNNPRTLTVGAGMEQYAIRGRKAGDGENPVIWAGAGPLFNAAFIEPAIAAFVKEPAVKGFTKAGCVSKFSDIEARAGFPSEIQAQLIETDAQIAALEKAGRPGMFLGNVNCPSPAAGAACIRPGRYEPTQCMMGVHITPEQKIDWSRLISALLCENLGVTPWASAMSMAGGLAGGAGGAAMCATANVLAQLSYSHSPWCNIAITDMAGSSKAAMPLSCMSAVLRAVERHLAIPTGVPCCDSTVSTCHEESIIGASLIALTAAASGAAINWFGGTSPLTVRIHDDIMKNVCGIRLEEVESIIHNLLKLLDTVKKEHEGQECPLPQQLFFSIYDLKTLEPKTDYKTAVEHAVTLMREAGVPLSESLCLD